MKASGEDASRESIESSNLRAGLLSHTGQRDRQGSCESKGNLFNVTQAGLPT